MRVLVPTGNFQYDVANWFAHDLAQAIGAERGHEAALLNLSNSASFKQSIESFKPDLILSIQGVGIDQSVVSAFPDVAWMVMGIDHPSHILGRIDKAAANKILITAIEESHLECWKILAPEKPAVFLAHPAPVAPPSARKPEFGLCFLGTWNSPEKMVQGWLGNFPEALIDHLSQALDTALKTRCAIASDVLDFNAPIWQGSRARFGIGLTQIDLLIRLILRSRLLKELDDAGIGIDIFGTGWDTSEWRHHRIHPAVTYTEALGIGARSLGVLSITPTYPAGSHERPLSCWAQGSVCVSTPSKFFHQSGFVPGLNYLEYDPWTSGSLSKAVMALPDFHASATRREALPESRARIHREHSPSARARQILRLAKTHFDLD